jgi:hypothetical protein
MVFDDSATRATAIGTANFSEGMVTYTKDDDAIQVYDGSNFVGVGSDSGLIHIETQSPSAVAAVNFNDVFSSTYDNYLIIGTLVNSSSAAETNLRMRVSATDATTGYNKNTVSGSDSWVFAGRVTNNTATSVPIAINTGSATKNFQTIVYKPFLTTNTIFESVTTPTTGAFFEKNTGGLINTTSYTGFTVLVSTGTTTGQISVYGYAKV